uniref:Disintegrin domain-containing protein n=1 Tax=Magallana gigas TaxID=29159 RepID=A0A8W8NJ34_MAGGI
MLLGDSMTGITDHAKKGDLENFCDSVGNFSTSVCGLTEAASQEEGEECDCGYRDDCTDQCCNSRDNLNHKRGCTLKVDGTGHKVQCSPTQGPCCRESCTFKPATNSSVCRPATECSEEEIYENDTCYVSDDKHIPHEFKIVVDEVKNYSRLDAKKEISVAAGTPCDNYRGYCDVFHRCRGVDNDGPLERLKNLIFGEETLSSI